MNVTLASGRGTCGSCYKPIKKESKQLVFSDAGYPFEHRYCKKCGIKYINKSLKAIPVRQKELEKSKKELKKE